MATFKVGKTKKGKSYRAEVYVKGQREGRTFDTKAEAIAWAAMRETELREQVETGIDKSRTVRDAMRKYSAEVSTTKNGAAWEQRRLKACERFEIMIEGRVRKFADIKLHEFSTTHYAALRDARRKSVSDSTVNREMNLLSHVFAIARKEWRWIKESPTADVRRPKEGPPRKRRISEQEIEHVCLSLGFYGDNIATLKSQRVAVAFLLAIETAMRAGELCSILRVKPRTEWAGQSWLAGNYVHLGKTKNGDERDVPLSPRARQLIELVPMTGPLLFGFEDAAQLQALWQKARLRHAIEDLHFHDTRHEAITRMSKIYDVRNLARIVGHRNLNQLLDYHNPTIEELVARMS